MTSLPNRDRSCLLAEVLISSIPQHAVANGIGQRLLERAQLAAASSCVQISPLEDDGGLVLNFLGPHRVGFAS